MKKRILTGLGFAFILIIFLISFLAAAEYSGETGSIFYIREGIFCPDEYNHTKWINTITDELYPTYKADPVFDCRDFQDINGEFAGEGACCPRIGSIFTTCQLVSSSEFSVELLPLVIGVEDRYTCLISDIRSCSDYTTEDECEDSSTTAIAEYSIESNNIYENGWCNKPIDTPWEIPISGVICSNFTSCSCIWDETNGCLADASKYWECDDGSTNEYLSCQYFINLDDSQCNEPSGRILKTWQAISGGSDCVDGTEEEPCADITRLSFFTWASVIAVIVILIVIYYLYAVSKKKKR